MRSDFENIIADLVRDSDSILSADASDRALDLAVTRYSVDKPRQVTEDLAASASGQRIDPPAAFVAGVSDVVQLEYPVDETPPVYIGASLYQGPLATFLDLDQAVTAGDTLRVTYTLTHDLDEVDDTIPLKHREAVCNYAAALACSQLAAYYAHDADSTISSDSVDHRSRSEHFSRLARQYESEYFRGIGVAKNRTEAAAKIVDLDRNLAGGGDRLFHSRRYR